LVTRATREIFGHRRRHAGHQQQRAQARTILDAWRKSGLLYEAEYTTPTHNKTPCIVLDEDKVASVLASLRGGREC